MLVSKVRQMGYNTVEIQDNDSLFWEVGLDDMFNVRADPPTLVMGSIQDSFEFLADMVASAESPNDAPPLMFVHMAAVMNFLAIKAKY